MILFIKSINLINTTNTQNILDIPLYIAPLNSFDSIYNCGKFAIIGAIILLPFYYLKTIKYNICAILGIILALNHFSIYDRLLISIDNVTPLTWSITFLNVVVIAIILFINTINKKLRIITTSMGGAYVAGYILYLVLFPQNQYMAFVYIIGFNIFYIIMYFISKKIRKFIMFSTMAGWNFYCCGNILTNCLLISYLYSSKPELKQKGILILLAFMITTLLMYIILRLFFYHKNKKTKVVYKSK